MAVLDHYLLYAQGGYTESYSRINTPSLVT